MTGVQRKSMRAGRAMILTFGGIGSVVQPSSSVGAGLGGGGVISSCLTSSQEAPGSL
jgi:hypothetical protein